MIIIQKIQNFITFLNYLINKTFGLTNVNYNEYTFIDDSSDNINNDSNIDANNDVNINFVRSCNLYNIFQNIIYRK